MFGGHFRSRLQCATEDSGTYLNSFRKLPLFQSGQAAMSIAWQAYWNVS